MSALTFVLNEIPGIDADEFRNVRSYHSCGKSYQEALRSCSGRLSPESTGSNKSSSGVSSLSDEEISKPKRWRLSTKWESAALPQLKKEKEVARPKEACVKDHRIMYLGRDILNLERNTQPHKWQLISPMFGFQSMLASYREYYRFEGLTLIEEYKMKLCDDCGFYEPTPYLES